MPSSDRDASHDRELVRLSYSSASSVPMWDSADPERAPPPLPLNPGSPRLTTRPNTSAAIANAAKALEEKARESMPASSYTTNPMPQRSPDRSLIKGATHKRMQSLQTTSVRDLKSFLDGVRSDRSPDRPTTRSGEQEKEYLGAELSPSPRMTLSPTLPSRDIFKDSPALRPSARPLQKAILGENTPPSATMLALQTMQVPKEFLDPPLPSATTTADKSSNAAPPVDAISSQLQSITNIVSSLQKDMTQLSRRSKDNASDLISLKEATNARDEDIRRSLKELVTTMSLSTAAPTTPGDASRSGSTVGFKDPHMTPTKQYSIPRMTSPSFFTDERIGSPNPYSVEGAASVAMLEKIIREMVTKDGQERLISNLQTLVDKATGETAKKVTELAEFIKQQGVENKSLAAGRPGSASFQPSPDTGPLTRVGDANPTFSFQAVANEGKPYGSPKAADFVSDEMLKLIRKIKDSVAESGCVTMGTKALIQDLRGEVLGMGRELARKIEEIEKTSTGTRSIENAADKQDVALVVQAELANLKQHLDQVMRDQRRQSMSSTLTRNTINEDEVYDVVKHALAERGLDQVSAQNMAVDTEAIIAAVREAYEAYKPSIEIQQIGLERDEILQCLREGLQDYQGSGSVTKEDIEHIIQESLQQIKLPSPINEAAEIREEVLGAVRECLQDFVPPQALQNMQIENVSREMILDAIREGLANRENMGPQELEISQEALFEAVRVGLESARPQTERQSDEVLQHLQALVDDMHNEFKAYSSANGRDTEQVLDALKDGLDTLRSQIETYVDKAQDVTQKDEIVDTFRGELERLRGDIQGYVAEGPRGDQAWPREDMVGFIKSEFDNLHESLASRLGSTSKDVDEILNTLNAQFEAMKSQVVARDLDHDTNEEINEAIKHEFEQLKEVLLGDAWTQKGEIVEKLQAGFEGLHTKLGESNADSNTELLQSLKEEFEYLRETIGGTLVRASGADKDDVVDAVRELIDDLRAQLAVSQEEASKSSLASIQEGLDQLKESLGSTLVHAESSSGKDEIIDTLKSGLEELKANSQSMGINEELLEAFRVELDQVRQSTGLIRQHSRADAEEVLEAVRLGLDDLRSHLEKKLDNPDTRMAATTEIIDALNDGLEGLRTEVVKTVDKPVDMTVSYEILDTLKDGIVSLREEIMALKDETAHSKERVSEAREAPTGTEIVLAEDPDAIANREVHEAHDTSSRDVMGDTLRRDDLEKMELMLGRLEVKVEAMDATMQHSSPATEPSSTPTATPGLAADLAGIQETLKDLREAVEGVQSQNREVNINVDGMATKGDTDAIETLLGNVKARIEELNLPDPDKMIQKEDLDDVELVVRTTSETIEELSKKLTEEGATKADVAVVQVIVDDIKLALDEMKASKAEKDPTQKVTKTDVDDLAAIVCDIKTKVDDMKIPDEDGLPSKADVEQLIGLVLEFRESHDKLKDQYEHDINTTAGAFDDRRKEAEGLSDSIAEVKVIMDEVKEDIKASLMEGGTLEGLKDSFKSLEDNVTLNLGVTADVKELMEIVSREFERAHGSIEGLQNTQEEKSALTLEKQEETKDAIIASLVEKVDDRFNVLMTKYDDAQLFADEQAKVMKEKAEEQAQVLQSTKAMADELRQTIETLSASIAGMGEKYEEVTQKFATDYSAAVFGKIDDAVAKIEEQKLEDKTEHSHTRDEIANVERIFNGLQDNITEYHPKFMVTLREIEALVKQHYDHSQKTKEAAEEQVRLMNEEARSRAEEVSKHLNSLPALLPPPPPAIEAVQKYDDTQVQEKLNKLIDQVSEAEKSAAQMERLEEIRKHVQATAAEVSDFVAKQTQLITDGNESKEREAEELALLIERRRAQKEHLEEDVENLRVEKEKVMQELKEEKDRAMAELRQEKEQTIMELQEEKNALLAAVAALQAERENLANQKVRLTGEVSSLHTALEIRREELHIMDTKADALERRILNGIMDHSRALMIAKGAPKSSSKQKKRMSTDSSTRDGAVMPPPPGTAANGLSLALKPRPAIRRNAPQNPTQRRILSLSQISGTNPTGAQAYSQASSAMANNTNIKRSHSVKTNYLRKSSWSGKAAAEANKENTALSQVDENDANPVPVELDESEKTPTRSVAVVQDTQSIAEEEEDMGYDSHSDAGTERRHSLGSSAYSESHVGEHHAATFDGRSSYNGGASEYSYISGSSYMTGSDIDDRRTSFGSTAGRSVVTGGANTIDEVSENEQSDADDVDDDPTTTISALNPSEVTDMNGIQEEGSDVTASDVTMSQVNGSEVTASEVTASQISGSEVSTQLPTQSEIDAAVEAVKAEMIKGNKDWALPSDSGLGSDLNTAHEGRDGDADYFRRAAEEESVVGA